MSIHFPPGTRRKLFSAPRLGVLGKVAAALCAVLIALAGLAFLAAQSTRDATAGAEAVESEFAERVKTGSALYTALVNVSIAEESPRVTSPEEIRALDRELSANDARLARQMSEALADPNGQVAAEAGLSGEVIGSVLVDHEQPLNASGQRRVHESVAQAAPILANLRNLALAEARAATDSLTGLPNRRAVQDTLKRMIAHSSRSMSPMAAILLDFDHFKQINDTFGHEEGDSVLASVGDVLASTVRTSDFVGRSGGEEFVALLPDTDEEGALEVAEKLRAAIAGVKLTRVDRAISASFGVAVHPDVANDAETLLRLADRALYAAKGGGRNRVELATGTSSPVGVGLALGELSEPR